MEYGLPPDSDVRGWLHTLGVGSLCQWHVLCFLSRHQTTLLGAEYLAGLLGYATEVVVVALDVLEAQELVERSRVSQGARLYKFVTLPVSPRGEAFVQLQALVGNRAGRRCIYTQLREGDGTVEETLQRARRRVRSSQRRIQEGRRQVQRFDERRQRWQKAM
jgi:hypothetical protein